MGTSYPEFSRRFKGLKPSPVYLFAGEERFFIDAGISLVRDRFLKGVSEDFNCEIYSATDIKASKVIEMAETLPVMADYRVVVVKGIDGWTSKEREVVLPYIKRPSPTTCLVLTAIKLDRREKFAVTVEKHGTVILCGPLYRQQLVNWMKQRVRSAGKSIEDDAVNMLADFSGNNMLTLQNDIEKLTMYCESRKGISLEDVAMVSSSMRSVSVFEIANAMVDRRIRDAILYLKKAIDDGEPPVRIFYFIVRELRMMLKTRILIDEGESPEKAALTAGVPRFKVREFSQRVQGFSRKELYALFERLIDIDSKLKGGAIRPGMALENLLISVC